MSDIYVTNLNTSDFSGLETSFPDYNVAFMTKGIVRADFKRLYKLFENFAQNAPEDSMLLLTGKSEIAALALHAFAKRFNGRIQLLTYSKQPVNGSNYSVQSLDLS